MLPFAELKIWFNFAVLIFVFIKQNFKAKNKIWHESAPESCGTCSIGKHTDTLNGTVELHDESHGHACTFKNTGTMDLDKTIRFEYPGIATGAQMPKYLKWAQAVH